MDSLSAFFVPVFVRLLSLALLVQEIASHKFVDFFEVFQNVLSGMTGAFLWRARQHHGPVNQWHRLVLRCKQTIFVFLI